MTTNNAEASPEYVVGEEPWKKRTDWAVGKIRSSHSGLVFLVLFTLFWNAVSWTVVVLSWPKLARKDQWASAFVALFPLIGVLMACLTVYILLRRMKFGTSVFEMASVPGVIGGPIAGVVQVPRKLHPEFGFTVKLNCIHHYQKGKESEQDLLWQDEQLLGRELFDESAESTAIPIQFAIPYDVRESEKGRGELILWQLEVVAEDPGIDYHETFDVPVFRTEASSPDFKMDDKVLAPFLINPTFENILRGAQILHEPTAGGGDSFTFPAARTLTPAVALTIFMAIWIGATTAMFYFGVPILFPIVFGLFGLLLAWGCLDLWLRSSRIEIDRDEVRIRSGWLGFGRTQSVPRAKVNSVETRQRMRSGTHAWHDVWLTTKGGDELNFGRYIYGPRLAKAVAELVMEAIRGNPPQNWAASSAGAERQRL